MKEIIDQTPAYRQQDVIHSHLTPPHLPSEDAISASANPHHGTITATPKATSPPLRWEMRDLEKSLNPNLSKLEREFWSWSFKNPGVARVPGRYSPVFDSLERRDLVEGFRVSTDKDARRIKEVKEQLDFDLKGRHERRKLESTLSDYVEAVVDPLGPMEWVRGDKVHVYNPMEIVDKLRSCRQSGTVGVMPGGGVLVAWDEKCGFSKLCPDESRAESLRLADKYIPASERFLEKHRGNTFQYAVLTVPNYPLGKLKEGKADIYRRFNQLMGRKCCENFLGTAARQEDPLSANGGWNVHLNVFFSYQRANLLEGDKGSMGVQHTF